MVEHRTQLFMMLVQQAGSGALPLSNLTPDMFLPFMRHIEENVIRNPGLNPLLVYWSTRDAHWLLPAGPDKGRLIRHAVVSVFSEEKSEKTDEFCFLLQSQGISLVLYGHLSDESSQERVYQCVGSMDPHIVKRTFQLMIPTWQFIDLPEANRLDDARAKIGSPVTAPHFVAGIRNEWPVIKQRAGPEVATAPPALVADSPGRKAAREIVINSASTGSLKNPAMVVRPGAEVPVPQPNLKDLFKEKPGEPEFDFGDLTSSPVFQPPVPVPGKNGEANRYAANRGREKNLKDLREVLNGKVGWTNITQEVPTVFPPDAQKIIRGIVSQLRISSDLNAILQMAIEELARVLRADRGLIWQVIDDQLVVTHEFALDGNNCFTGTNLGTQESAAIVGEFILQFPDESGYGVIAISDSAQDTKFRRLSPTLAAVIELGSVQARVVAQIRCRSYVSGFLELQQTSATRDWSEQDGAILQSVSEVLSLVVQESLDLQKMANHSEQMKLVNEIAALFRESGGLGLHGTLEKSLNLLKTHTNFEAAQIFLFNDDDGMLVPQTSEKEHSEPIPLDKKNNPFLQVFVGGKLKVFNQEFQRRGDPFFHRDMAVVIPLMSEGGLDLDRRLGVLGLWRRKENSPMLQQDTDLVMAVVSNLASFLRADQAIAQIRAERARASLINNVSNEIQQSLKEVDPIIKTMVDSLADYFSLPLCMVSVFDPLSGGFSRSIAAGDYARDPDSLIVSAGELLCTHFVDILSQGQCPSFMGKQGLQEVQDILKDSGIELPAEAKMVLLMPLRQGTSLKGGLTMVFSTREKFPVMHDMHMIGDLLNRVAVVLAHKELFEQVERQAVTDAMTGLHNRRYFQEQLSKELDRYQRFGHPFSYIILDLDYLKRINDNLGHQYGDDAIKHIAQIIKRCVRDVDTTARYGGEEFVVLLPETDAEGARIVAERMCAAIREKELLPDNEHNVNRHVTASIGVATFPLDTDDRDKLTELADQALYLAKHRGRNQVCSVSVDLLPSLKDKTDEAVEVQCEALKKKTQALSGIDVKLIAEHGILGLLSTVIKLIEERDSYNADRSPRMAEYSQKIAVALRLSKENTTIISLAAILNNLGKIGIDEKILQKKGELTPEERRLVESSPHMSAKILEPARHLHKVASVVEAYHEHWDGSGYPRGLKGEEIPLESRIVALVDAYVAMTSDRPWRKAMPRDQAVQELMNGSGKEWDPRLVKLFVAILQKD